MDANLARKMWRGFEAVHGMIYFTPDAAVAYAGVGVTHHRTGYFASRAAPMGAVSASTVIATFFNFHPDLVRRSMNGAWEAASPAVLHEARMAAVDSSLRRAFGDEVLASDDLAWAASHLRRAAATAADHLEGRPLFAGHAGLGWPTEPHLELWHAQTLLREFRGDGHIAALVNEGLGGLDALITHAASGDVPAAALKATREWSDEEWDSGIAALAARGLIDADGQFTDAGRAQRDRIESTTDAGAVVAYSALDGLADVELDRLRGIGRDLSQRVVAAGLLPFR